MTKVSVVTDGWIDQETAETMIDMAEEVKAEVRALRNGIVAVFEYDDDAEWFRQSVLDSPQFQGKLASLSTGPA